MQKFYILQTLFSYLPHPEKKSKELKKISNQKQAEEGIAEKKMSVLSSRLDQGFGQRCLLRADLCLHGL